MRLIDADALQNLFNDTTTSLLGRAEIQKDAEHMVRAFLRTTEMIRDAATVDAVPVVRCRDCKHCVECVDNAGATTEWECHLYIDYHTIEPDDFCSFGERKVENDDVHQD